MISVKKAKLDTTTMLTYSHANTPLGQLERTYYLSYLINMYGSIFTSARYMYKTVLLVRVWRGLLRTEKYM